MSSTIIEKYKTLKPITDDETVHKMLQILVDTPQDQVGKYFGQSKKAGGFYLFEHDAFPGKVIEYLQGHAGDDSVTTLYEGHPIFHSRQALLEAREEIIGAIDHLLMAVPGTTVVQDHGRERQVFLNELGTAQLLDTLAHFSQSSPGILAV